MTVRTVLRDTGIACVAYLAGFVALLLWPNRASANQNLVLIVGIGAFALFAVAGDWLVNNRRPSLGLLRNERPARYSLPNFFGLFFGFIVASWLRTGAPQDSGLTTYCVVLVVIAGATVSNLWWAHASAHKPDDIGAR